MEILIITIAVIISVAISALITHSVNSQPTSPIEDKMARKAIDELCNELGFKQPIYYNYIEKVVIFKDYLIQQHPVSMEEFRKSSSKITELHSLLLNYFGLEIFEGKELRKKKK